MRGAGKMRELRHGFMMWVQDRSKKCSYQSGGIGAIDAEQGDGRANLLGRGIGTHAVNGGRAGDGELSGTEASASEASGHHDAIGGLREERVVVE